MTLRKYDLNLLTILDALLRHRSVTQAGQELGLTQSATSHALLRLREQFDDRLLVSSGRSMALTPRAEAMLGPVTELLQMAERIVAIDKFEAGKAIRRFRVGMGDYVALILLSGLINHLQSEAPNITLQVTWAGRDIASKLLVGDLDLAIVPEFNTSERIHSKRLFTDEFVIIAARNHPSMGETISKETFQNQSYATFRDDASGSRSFVDLQLAKHHISTKQVLIVPNFLLLPFVVATTHCLAVVHRRMAERMAESLPIKLITPSFEIEPLKVCAYWSHRAHSDPGHQWFRDQLTSICEQLHR
jgi:LysR family transcriptional regulator, nod-box dependent transcriptional activator